MSKVFQLQQQIVKTLVEKIRTNEVDLNRAKIISAQVLVIISETATDIQLVQILDQLQLIPEFTSTILKFKNELNVS